MLNENLQKKAQEILAENNAELSEDEEDTLAAALIDKSIEEESKKEEVLTS